MIMEEVAVASFQILSRHFRAEANVNHKNLHNPCPVQDMKPYVLHSKQEDRSNRRAVR
jgi:hypothetical protein